MATYLFITKPKYHPERVADGVDLWWSCSSTMAFGDRALVYVTGVGIHYEWRMRSDARRHRKWKFICDVEHSRTFDSPITLGEMRGVVSKDEWMPPFLNFRGYKSIIVPDAIAHRIQKIRPAISEAELGTGRPGCDR